MGYHALDVLHWSRSAARCPASINDDPSRYPTSRLGDSREMAAISRPHRSNPQCVRHLGCTRQGDTGPIETRARYWWAYPARMSQLAASERVLGSSGDVNEKSFRRGFAPTTAQKLVVTAGIRFITTDARLELHRATVVQASPSQHSSGAAGDNDCGCR